MNVVLKGASLDIIAEVKEGLSCLVLWVDVDYNGEYRKGIGVRAKVELMVHM